jgi:hypothetical protein
MEGAGSMEVGEVVSMETGEVVKYCESVVMDDGFLG